MQQPLTELLYLLRLSAERRYEQVGIGALGTSSLRIPIVFAKEAVRENGCFEICI